MRNRRASVYVCAYLNIVYLCNGCVLLYGCVPCVCARFVPLSVHERASPV